MDKEKFIKAYLNAKPLPVADITEARKLENSRSSRTAKVPFSGHIDDVIATTSQGATKVRIYNPPGAGPFPAFLQPRLSLRNLTLWLLKPFFTPNVCKMLESA